MTTPPAPAPDDAAAPPRAPALRVVAAPTPLTEAERREVERAEPVLHGVLDELDRLLPPRAGGVDSELKDDGTLVSPADEQASARLEAALTTLPGHAVLSEEASTTYDGAEWTWVVDPIDGTSNFVAGLPWWCTSVALLRRGEPVLAAISAPAIGTRLAAVLGDGCRRDGRPCHVRAGHDLGDRANRHVPMFVNGGTIRRATGWAAIKPRIMGAAALDMGMVAAGVAVGALSRDPKAWDVAAGTLLVMEAGGVVVTIDAEPHLPLDVGADYVDDGRPTMAGPTVAWLAELVTRVGVSSGW